MMSFITYRKLYVMNSVLCHTPKWFFLPPPAGNIRRFFSDIYCENLCEFPEITPQKYALPTMTESPGVSDSQICPHLATSNSPIIVQVFLPHPWFPQRFLLWYVVILCIPLSLQSGGELFALWLSFSYRSKKSCQFFSLFSFLPVDRTDRWPLRSLYVELKVQFLFEIENKTKISAITASI